MVRDGPSAEAATPPQSLLQWLSQQYVSKVEVQASLATLELNLLQNISLELQQHLVKDAVREDILPSTGAAVTQQVSFFGGGYCTVLGINGTLFWMQPRKVFTDQLSPAGRPCDCGECSAPVFPGQNWPGGLRSGIWRFH